MWEGIAAGLAGGAASGLVSGAFNTAAASRAYDRSKNWATRHHLYERIALDAAGYNPILAMTQGKTGSSMKAPQAGPINPQFNLAQAMQLGAQANLAGAQTDQVTEATKLTEVERKLKEADLPRAEAVAEFWRSEQGQNMAQQIVTNEAVPDGFWAQVNKWAYQAAERLGLNPVDIIESIGQEAKEILDMRRTRAGVGDIPPKPKRGQVSLGEPYMRPHNPRDYNAAPGGSRNNDITIEEFINDGNW